MDEGVATECHRDLVELSGRRLLARAILERGRTERANWKELGVQIAEAIVAGRIDRRRLGPKLLSKVVSIAEVKERFPRLAAGAS